MLAIYVHVVGLRRLAAPRSRNCTESSRNGRSFYLDGNLIREIASMVGGGGGGRPDMAQAGGRNPDALPKALEAVYGLVGA